MSVITISITESPIFIISGIPKNITITSSTPSNIYYTLDGTDPTTNSLIVTGPIDLTTPGTGIVLKVFAFDGINSSAIISQIYGTTVSNDTRRPRDKVIGSSSSQASQNYGIFGSNSPNPNVTYGGIGGDIVDSPNVAGIPDGYDGAGGFANETDGLLNSYKFIYSDSDYLGQQGKGIGTLPANIKIIIPSPPPTSSDTSKKLFNPRALVIIQDGTKPPDDPNLTMINRANFSLQSSGKYDDGSNYSKTAMEGAVCTGSFLKQYYNPRDQTITYYYFDSQALRWIISKEPYVAKDPNIFNYSLMIMPSRGGTGAKYVYSWKPFQRRVLF